MIHYAQGKLVNFHYLKALNRLEIEPASLNMVLLYIREFLVLAMRAFQIGLGHVTFTEAPKRNSV